MYKKGTLCTIICVHQLLSTAALTSPFSHPHPRISSPYGFHELLSLEPPQFASPLLPPIPPTSICTRVVMALVDYERVARAVKEWPTWVLRKAKVAAQYGFVPLGHEGRDSVYVHASTPAFAFPPDFTFRVALIPGGKVSPRGVGDFSMVAAERKLLAGAFFDPLNAFFALLSDSHHDKYRMGFRRYERHIFSPLICKDNYVGGRQVGRGAVLMAACHPCCKCGCIAALHSAAGALFPLPNAALM
ncbi:unnamed protein product [Closterium sp. Naga37s-1]|nr:unnamed protein product [Closterium sp. Naga37s-1]